MTRFAPGYKGPKIDPMIDPEGFKRLVQSRPPDPRIPVVGATPPPPRGGKGFPISGMRPPGQATTGGPKPAPAPIKRPPKPMPMMKKGGKVSSASKRADGCAVKGKTKGRMV
jgi:hypothetical protein